MESDDLKKIPENIAECVNEALEEIEVQVNKLHDPLAKELYTPELNTAFRNRIEEMASRRYSPLDGLFYADSQKAIVLRISITTLDVCKTFLDMSESAISFIESTEDAARRLEQHPENS